MACNKHWNLTIRRASVHRTVFLRQNESVGVGQDSGTSRRSLFGSEQVHGPVEKLLEEGSITYFLTVTNTSSSALAFQEWLNVVSGKAFGFQAIAELHQAQVKSHYLTWLAEVSLSAVISSGPLGTPRGRRTLEPTEACLRGAGEDEAKNAGVVLPRTGLRDRKRSKGGEQRQSPHCKLRC